MKGPETVRPERTGLGPRPGTIGWWDRSIGPGATRSENVLVLLWGLLGAAAITTYALWADLGWSAPRLAAVALLAFDVGGGVPANAYSSAKRWFHRPRQGFWEHFAFPLVHVHPFALALLFPGFGWGTATVVYVYLLAAAAAILIVPLYLKRPVAFVLYCAALLGGLYALDAPQGLEWFVPLFFLKLLVAHLLSEEAHRPYKGEV